MGELAPSLPPPPASSREQRYNTATANTSLEPQPLGGDR